MIPFSSDGGCHDIFTACWARTVMEILSTGPGAVGKRIKKLIKRKRLKN